MNLYDVPNADYNIARKRKTLQIMKILSWFDLEFGSKYDLPASKCEKSAFVSDIWWEIIY